MIISLDSNEEVVLEAVNAARANGCKELVVLHCVSGILHCQKRIQSEDGRRYCNKI